MRCRIQRKLSLSTLQSNALRDGKKAKKKKNKMVEKKTKPRQAKANGYPNERIKDVLIADESIEMAAIEMGLAVGNVGFNVLAKFNAILYRF